MDYILVVDDNQSTNEMVEFILKKAGYEVNTLDNARNALQMIQKREPDLLLLDVIMPYISGFEFSVKLRAEDYNIPIIFMTATSQSTEDKIQGFNLGADDYICKPLDPQELVARVKAVLRRSKKNGKMEQQSIRVGRFELFPAELKVVKSGCQAITLTPTEMRVLQILMVNAPQVVRREQLLSDIWNDNDSTSNNFDVYIRRLRTKLAANAIITVRGIGYKFIG